MRTASTTPGPLRRQQQWPLGFGPLGLWLCCAGAWLLGGCGNTLYAIQANSAAAKVEEAHALGAEEYAPYEYYYAREHLRKAQHEAAEADYGDAAELAGISEDYAEKAIRLTRDARRGAGR